MKSIKAIKGFVQSQYEPEDLFEEMTDEELRLQVEAQSPFFTLESAMATITSLSRFARGHSGDKEFALIICKKIVKDIRAAADVFEDNFKEK